MRCPRVLKWLILLGFAATWKFTYYSARTLSTLRGYQPISFTNFCDIRQIAQRRMWFELFIPYVTFNFIALPFLFESIASGFGWAFLYARIIAEVLHNIQMFVVIIPNHSGADLYRFDNVAKNNRRGAEYYVRQVLGSANYHTGKEWIDFSHMYLNYQIEHHLFPNLPMRQYRIIQPQVKAACEKYGIPYVQESVFIRTMKMVDVATGKAKMLRLSASVITTPYTNEIN